jgi:hypothetical protein
LETFANARDKRIGVALACGGADAHSHFDMLHQDKQAIVAEVGPGLDWFAPAGKKQCRILLRRPDTDPALRDKWPEQLEWLRQKLELFHRVFAPRVKNMDASDHVAQEVDP